jgi:hypothetical protein
MTYGTNSNLIILLHAENATLTNQDLNTSLDEQDTQWNVHLVLNDNFSLSPKPSSTSQLSS